MDCIFIMKEVKAVLKRIKELKEYEVMLQVPESFRMNGRVPFDMYIAGSTAFVKVMAESIEEATHMAETYFKNAEQ